MIVVESTHQTMEIGLRNDAFFVVSFNSPCNSGWTDFEVGKARSLLLGWGNGSVSISETPVTKRILSNNMYSFRKIVFWLLGQF